MQVALQPESATITYQGGPLMKRIISTTYGNSQSNNAVAILPEFGRSLGGSPYYNINTTYTNSAGAARTMRPCLGWAVKRTASQGRNWDIRPEIRWQRYQISASGLYSYVARAGLFYLFGGN